MNATELKIVENFAQKNGCKSGVEYLGRWKPKGFDVYIVKSDANANNKEPVDIGLPTIILFKDGRARYAKPGSVIDIMAYINKQDVAGN